MRFVCTTALLAAWSLTTPGADMGPSEAEDRVAAGPVSENSGDPAITLQEAILAVLAGNPGLAATRWDIEIGQAGVTQAGLRPNPELTLEIEDIRWSRGPSQRTRTRSLSGAIGSGSLPTLGWERETEPGARSGFTESELTLSIAQVIELGGKRAKRIAAAEEAKQLALWDYETLRADVVAGTARAFVAVLAAQEKLALEDDLERLADEVARTFRVREEAGQVSPIEAAKAEVALASTRLERERAAADLRVARIHLAAMWGDETPRFGEAAGHLDGLPALPAVDDLRMRLDDNPDIARWASELAARKAGLALERANRIPDATLELGWKSTGLAGSTATRYGFGSDGGFGLSRSASSFDSGRDNSVILGVSLPLPLFDRNQGGIAAAEFEVSKAADSSRATAVSVVRELQRAHEEAAVAQREIGFLERDILPQAADIYEKTQRGYRQGKFDYLDVLDAQRTLFEARTTYVDALERYHLAVIALERLTGTSLARWETAAFPRNEEIHHAE